MCTYAIQRLASTSPKEGTCIDNSSNHKLAGFLEAKKLMSNAAYAKNVNNLEQAVAAPVSDAAHAEKIKSAAE